MNRQQVAITVTAIRVILVRNISNKVIASTFC